MVKLQLLCCRNIRENRFRCLVVFYTRGKKLLITAVVTRTITVEDNEGVRGGGGPKKRRSDVIEIADYNVYGTVVGR